LSIDRSASGSEETPPPYNLAAVQADDVEHQGDSNLAFEPSAQLSGRYIAFFLIASLTLYAAWIAPSAYTMAIRLEQIDALTKNTALAFAIGIPGFAVMVTGPLLGVISDRTKSIFGRRRFWFLGGTACGFLGSMVVGLVHSIPLAIAGWTAAYIGYTAAAGMLTAHLGDRLPEAQRGRVAGLTASVSQVGPVVGIVLAGRFTSLPFLMLAVPAVIGLAGGLFFAAVMKDPLPESEPGNVDVKVILEGFWFNPRVHRNFAWVWLSRAFVFLSLSFTSVYSVYLLSERLHLEGGLLANLVASAGLAGLPVAILGAVTSGWLSDRFKRRKPFLVVSALLVAAGAVVTATMTSLPQFYVGVLVGTLGIGAYGATDQALILDVLPREENQNGRYLAIIGLASQLPQAAGPFLAGFIIRMAYGNYTWVYLTAAIFAVIGGFLILPVKYVWHNAAPAESDFVTAPL
jgi:MFS family permease